MTKYVPKRMAFEYPYFIMRVMLAALDHNFHLFRKANPRLMVDVATGSIQSAPRSTTQNLWRKRRRTDTFPSWLTKCCGCVLKWREVSTCHQIVMSSIRNKLQQQLGWRNPLPQRNSSKGLHVLLGNKKCKLPVHPWVQSRSLGLEKLVSLGLFLWIFPSEYSCTDSK